MSTLQQLFGLEVEVMHEDEFKVAQVMAEHEYADPHRVKDLPANWWEEEVQTEFITFAPARELLEILKSEGVELTRIRLWHPPHEDRKKPLAPEPIVIPWKDIGKMLAVVAGACIAAMGFLLTAAVFLIMALLAGIDPWLVVDLPSGVSLRIMTWQEEQ